MRIGPASIIRQPFQISRILPSYIALLIEYESEVYNRALNDVLRNLEKKPKAESEIDTVRKMWLSSRELPVSETSNKILPFSDEYYDAAANRVEPAIVEKINQTNAIVRNLRDGKRWQIPLCSINVRGSDTNIALTNNTGLSKNELSVGDTVGFIDKSGVEQHGIAVRLNQNTVTVEAGNRGWRVSYALLYKVIEHNKD